MTNNFLSKLKEQKKLMKLSMTALVSAVAICGGTSLYSASAMKRGDSEPSKVSATKSSESQPVYEGWTTVEKNGKPSARKEISTGKPKQKKHRIVEISMSLKQKIGSMPVSSTTQLTTENLTVNGQAEVEEKCESQSKEISTDEPKQKKHKIESIMVGDVAVSKKDLYSLNGFMDFHGFNEDTLRYLFAGIPVESFKDVNFKVITGRGNHSVDKPILKEQVQEYLPKGIAVNVDLYNEGIVIIGEEEKSEVIPEELKNRYERLKALMYLSKTADYNKLAVDSEWRKTLIAYGKIPNAVNRLEALKAVIEKLGSKYEKVAESEQGREALIAYGKIPGRDRKSTRLNSSH